MDRLEQERMERVSLYGIEANLLLHDWLVMSYTDERPIHKLMAESCQFLGHPSNGRFCFCGSVLKLDEQVARSLDGAKLMSELEGNRMETKVEEKKVVDSWRPKDEADFQAKLARFREEQRELYQKWRGVNA